ncbi:MAG TPA: coenzyme F420-0:L-glutamate ligase [Actinomycetota bacterium]
MSLSVHPVEGLPEIREGDDLAAMIAAAAALLDGDVVVVTQKAVSKAEGRVVPDGDGRDSWVRRETRRVVGRRGTLVIAETRHGFVCANAGVDLSNVAPGFVSLLPEDPDASAERIRHGVRERTGREVGVVISDTFGRPWRRGVTEVALGTAGMGALLDLRGTPDRQGRILESTVVAVADEVSAAAGLVMGKAQGIPAAVVRGLRLAGATGAGRDLIRPAAEDLFRYAPGTAITSRRTIRTFGQGPVPRQALVEAAASSLTAPVPHGSRHDRPPWLWAFLEPGTARGALLASMGRAWERDLRADGTPEAEIARRRERSDRVLADAPVLAVPALSLDGADPYPDPRRREAERDMFVLATGAAVQNLMLSLHAQGLGSAWISSTLFCREETAGALGLAPSWLPMGAVAIGPLPEDGPPERPAVDPGPAITWA